MHVTLITLLSSNVCCLTSDPHPEERYLLLNRRCCYPIKGYCTIIPRSFESSDLLVEQLREQVATGTSEWNSGEGVGATRRHSDGWFPLLQNYILTGYGSMTNGASKAPPTSKMTSTRRYPIDKHPLRLFTSRTCITTAIVLSRERSALQACSSRDVTIPDVRSVGIRRIFARDRWIRVWKRFLHFKRSVHSIWFKFISQLAD
jgi:hypothetical protein